MIIANWKMNGTSENVRTWIEQVSNNIDVKPEKVCVFCPPACYLEFARDLIRNHKSQIKLGSQIINSSHDRALTGGLSAAMLRDIDTDFVLIGHSQQRSHLREDSRAITSKITSAIEENLRVVFCIGEDSDVKKKNETQKFLSEQLEVLKNISLVSIVVAYEPIWAIGSGQVATREYIEEIHKFVKNHCQKFHYSEDDISVVYGGSVKLENCEEIISSNFVDGLLIGGASLDPEIFSSIYNLS